MLGLEPSQAYMQQGGADCNHKSKYATDKNYVCNPVSGRWVKIGGPNYNKLVEQGQITASPVATTSKKTNHK